MNAKLWNILTKYEYLGEFADSIGRVIQGTQSDSDYMTIYSNYRNLDLNDSTVLDSIVGDKIGYILF